jgi:hypothetical protein
MRISFVIVTSVDVSRLEGNTQDRQVEMLRKDLKNTYIPASIRQLIN